MRSIQLAGIKVGDPGGVGTGVPLETGDGVGNCVALAEAEGVTLCSGGGVGNGVALTDAVGVALASGDGVGNGVAGAGWL